MKASRPRIVRVLSLCVLLVPYLASAGELVGRVVKIQDGDTLTVLVSRKQIKVRLTEIDAPERKQPFYTRSRESLAELCANKDARVVEKGKDRYGRTLGRVTFAGMDANAEQMRGMARELERYAPRGSSLYALQLKVSDARRCLWGNPSAVAPWEWKRTTKTDTERPR